MSSPLITDLVRQLDAASPESRLEAVRQLVALGPQAAVAASALAQALLDTDRRVALEAARGLVGIGESAAPHLKAWMIKSGGQAYAAVINLFKEHGQEASSLAPALTPLLRDANYGGIAAQLLAGMGEAGIPYLVEALRDIEARENPNLYRSDNIFGDLVDIIIGDTLADEALNPNRHIIWALTRLGEAAFPAYREMFDDSDLYMRRAAIAALKSAGSSLMNWKIEPDMVDAVCSMLQVKNRILNIQTLHTLGLMGERAHSAEPMLVEMLRGVQPQAGDTLKNANIIYTLGNIGAKSDAAIQVIIGFITHKSQELAQAASHALRQMGSAAAPAIPLIVQWVEHLARENKPTYDASETLGRIGQAAVPAIGELLTAGNDKLRECGVRAIERLEPAQAEGFLNALAEGVRTTTNLKDCREWLVLLGLREKMELPPEVLQVMADYEERRKAKLAEEESIDFNLERLKRSEDWERSSAAYHLSKADERLDEIGPAMLEALMLTVDNYQLEQFARRMIEMGSKISMIGPDLIPLIFGDRQALGIQAVKILESLAPNAPKDTALAAVSGLKHGSPLVRAGSAVALGACGAALLEAVPDAVARLCGLLNDTDPTVRLKAAWALGHLGARASSALPLLRELKKDLRLEIVSAAEVAIARIRSGLESPAPS